MSKFDKFKAIFAAVEPFAKPIVPGAAGTALDAVAQILNSHPTAASPASAEALKNLADEIDAMAQAMLALHQRNEDQETRIAALEAKLGL